MLLTTQYLDEAEQLADRIAILHEGRIIVNGTLAELKALLPPAKVEYVEKQPTLEDVFLASSATTPAKEESMTTHFVGDTAAAHGPVAAPHHPQPRHHHHHDDHADRVPAALRVRLWRRDRHRHGVYVDYLLPGILIITIASGVSYTAYRLFMDLQSGIFERFQSMPIARSAVLWAHVLTSLAALAISLAGRRGHGIRSSASAPVQACSRGSP